VKLMFGTLENLNIQIQEKLREGELDVFFPAEKLVFKKRTSS
jgi:hypothetical protein